MIRNTEWHNVLGNNISALDTYRVYLTERTENETLATWIERKDIELWGETHTADGYEIDRSEYDYERMAEALRKDAAELVANEAENEPFNWFGAVRYNLDCILYDAHGDGWTVGSNGDTQDFTERRKAVEALAYQWQLAELE